MADVTEVIHKITYEVNNDALNSATVAIQVQIQELNKLALALNAYNTQLAKLSSEDVRLMNELKAKINTLGSEMERISAKSAGLLQSFVKGAAQGISGSKGLKDAVAGYVSGVIKEFKKIEEAGKKIENTNRVVVTGFARNIEDVGAQNSKTSSTFDKLSAGLTSVTSVLDIGVQLLILFAGEMKGVDEQIGLVTGSMKIMSEIDRSAAGDIAKVSTEIDILKSRFFDAKSTIEDKTEVVNELNEKFGDTIGQIKGISDAEAFFVKKSEAFVKAMTIRAKIQGAYNLIASNQQKLLEAQAAPADENVGFTGKFKGFGIGALNAIKGTGIPGKSAIDFSVSYNQVLRDENEKLLKEAADKTEEAAKYLGERLKEWYAELRTINTENNFNPGGTGGDNNSQPKKNAGKRLKRERQDTQERLQTREQEQLPVNIDTSITPLDTEGMQKREAEEREQKAKEQKEKEDQLKQKRRENIKSAIDDYKQLAQAAADAYNQIIQAQINALEQEISIREKRVEEAKKLAEKGNVEALRIEEERLRKAQQQKERYVRQQQAVNAALTVSNAIAAVAEAAAAGGGFGSIATIAALIAALAAGYAAVTSMSNDSSQAFADGVVGYKGKGGPRDDKNWVRISSGESIITAEGTQRNRALLEAINKGAALHMIDPSLPLLMPMLKQPAAITGNTYATAGDMNKLEQKLDEVVDAIADNKMKQNIFFNEHGVGVMTERAMKKDRRRWS